MASHRRLMAVGNKRRRLIDEIDALADEYATVVAGRRRGQVSDTEVWELEQLLLGAILRYKNLDGGV